MMHKFEIYKIPKRFKAVALNVVCSIKANAAIEPWSDFGYFITRSEFIGIVKWLGLFCILCYLAPRVWSLQL